LFGMVLRGKYNVISQLKPWDELWIPLGGMLFLGTLVCYLQSVLGTLFFIPKSLIPGYHRFVIPITKVPLEKQEDECIICYYSLKYSPDEQQESAAQPPSEANEGMMPNTESLPIANSALTHHNLGGTNISNNTGVTQPMLKKLEKCFYTPCKHYFHEYCMMKWIEKKPECPTCRTKITYFK
jgi:RING-H2 zinc finger domain